MRLQQNNNTFQESSLWANQQLLKKKNKLLEAQNLNIDGQCLSRKQNVSPDNVLLFETLHYNTQEIIIFCFRQAAILSPQFLCYHCYALQ